MEQIYWAPTLCDKLQSHLICLTVHIFVCLTCYCAYICGLELLVFIPLCTWLLLCIHLCIWIVTVHIFVYLLLPEPRSIKSSRGDHGDKNQLGWVFYLITSLLSVVLLFWCLLYLTLNFTKYMCSVYHKLCGFCIFHTNLNSSSPLNYWFILLQNI